MGYMAIALLCITWTLVGACLCALTHKHRGIEQDNPLSIPDDPRPELAPRPLDSIDA